MYATETTPGVAGHFSDVEVMERMLREDILAAKAQADVVLPFFHWGKESTYDPLPYQVRLARAAIEAGAAGVLGSHPHVLQAMELHQGAPAIYSLGNFVFGGNWNPRDKRSALYQARFSPGGLSLQRALPAAHGPLPGVPRAAHPRHGPGGRGGDATAGHPLGSLPPACCRSWSPTARRARSPEAQGRSHPG